MNTVIEVRTVPAPEIATASAHGGPRARIENEATLLVRLEDHPVPGNPTAGMTLSVHCYERAFLDLVPAADPHRPPQTHPQRPKRVPEIGGVRIVLVYRGNPVARDRAPRGREGRPGKHGDAGLAATGSGWLGHML